MLSTFFQGNKRTVLLKKNVIASFVLNGGSILISFVLVPMTLGYLNEYEYGVWLTLNSILSWIYIFDIGLGNGLRNRLTEALARNDFQSAKIYVSTSFFCMSIIAGLIFGIFFLAQHFIDWYGFLNVDPTKVGNLDSVIVIVVATVCLTFVFKLIGSIYMAHQLPAVNNLLTFLGSLVSLIVIAILKQTTDGSLKEVAITFTASAALIYILAYPLTFKKYKTISPSFNAIKLSHFKSLATLGINFMLIQIAVLVIFMTSNVIISRLFGPEEVTPYNIAFKLFSAFNMAFTILLSPLWSAVTDAYTRGDYNWIRHSMQKMKKIWILMTIAMIITVMLAKYLYNLWVGDEVVIPLQLSAWMAVYIALSSLSNLYANIINGFGKLKLQLISALIQGIVYIPLAVWCSKLFGVCGILVALSAICLFSSVINGLQCRLLMSGKDCDSNNIWNK